MAGTNEVDPQNTPDSSNDEPKSVEPTPQNGPDLNALMAKISELENKLTSTHSENAEKRHKLKTQREQYENLAAEYEQMKADYGSKMSEFETLTKELNAFKELQEAERTSLLATMKEEHQTMFADLSLDKLRAIHSELYQSTPTKTPQQSVGSTKPPMVSETEPKGLFGLSRVRYALSQK